MKKIIFLLIFIIVGNIFIYAQDGGGFLLFSFSKEYNENNYKKYSIGYERILETFYFTNDIRLNYSFGEIGNNINMHYYIMPQFKNWILIGNLFIITFGTGTNISYNISKNIWGIGPHIMTKLSILYFIQFNIAYRYNIYFSDKDSNEIEFTVGLMDLIFR